ncbi:hypothetical protein FHS57_003759 [Runella defluvii]|uniref:Uncharacterized protein n=1 Tax=Runella defluvii TaxID=370973 RepID=A0A7W5ZLT9_9BACT|nr:hypothetical protein [Runella defluvii]
MSVNNNNHKVLKEWHKVHKGSACALWARSLIINITNGTFALSETISSDSNYQAQPLQ